MNGVNYLTGPCGFREQSFKCTRSRTVVDPGGEGAMPPPGPVKISREKDGRRRCVRLYA